MELPEEVTPQMLVNRPVLLLHAKDFSEPLTSLDGLVGCVIDDGKFIITSPNCKTIFDPPLGGDRQLFLRSNLRYGDDDPLQWPQPFVDSYSHIPCIPRSPVSGKNPENIMWYIPTRRDFVADSVVFSGVGKLQRSLFRALQSLALVLIERVHASKFKEEILVAQLSSVLKHLLHRLEFISTGFFTMCLGVRETQRIYLELTGLLNYMEHYRLRSTSLGTIDNIVGGFTHDPLVCERFFKAGIPVWLIRPYSALTSIRIRALAPVTKPVGVLPLDPPSRPVYPAIYRGRNDVLEKYIALAKSVLSYLKYPNPFGSLRAKPLAAPLPVTAPTQREIRSQRYTPYSNKSKAKQKARSDGQNKFHDLVDRILPPAIPSWRLALDNFDVATAQFVYEVVNPTDLGYVFPEPAMFLRTQTIERRETYFKSWLKYRSAFIYRVSSKDFTATPMPTSVWRDVLTCEHTQNKKDSTSKQSDETLSERLRTYATDFLQNCIQVEDVSLVGLEKGEMKWNGKVVQTLSDNEREEILWELSELNFRFELLALHSRATTTPDKDPQELVSACFSGCNSRSLLVADLGTANHGLADGNWEDRALYLHALKRLMMSWKGDIPSILRVEKSQWLERDIYDLEIAITGFYVKSFYNYFRRAPIVPRGLSHVASLYCIPEPPAITILDPRPDLFYDVSVFCLL